MSEKKNTVVVAVAGFAGGRLVADVALYVDNVAYTDEFSPISGGRRASVVKTLGPLPDGRDVRDGYSMVIYTLPEL